MSKFIPVVGLEIHVELSTKSKMFCGCPADWFGKYPNTHTCPVCLAMPGALPVPNKQAIEWTIRLATALNCKINKISKFDRKHYFYHDLPKGYQISQYDEPLGVDGHVSISRSSLDDSFNVNITRVHLEEDTGKLSHVGDDSLVDFNRAGVPLVEIVTEPDFDNSDDAKLFLEELQRIVRAIGVCDADMEKGSMRLEPNISVRQEEGDANFENHRFELPNYKVEVKNINSFKFAKSAIDFEVERQTKILEKGKTPAQETRGYNENKKVTVSQRSKEFAHDYRYFPDPDIPPLNFTEQQIEAIIKNMPELPRDRRIRYVNDLKLRYDVASIMAADAQLGAIFDTALNKSKNSEPAKLANILTNKRGSVVVSGNIEKSVEKLLKLASDNASIRLSDEDLTRAVENVLKNNEQAVVDYKAGKENALQFLLGQVMRETKGKGDTAKIEQELVNQLS